MQHRIKLARINTIGTTAHNKVGVFIIPDGKYDTDILEHNANMYHVYYKSGHVWIMRPMDLDDITPRQLRNRLVLEQLTCIANTFEW